MGWLALAIIAVAAAAGLWALGVSRTLASFAGAALMLGATGYALQGRPGAVANPVRADSQPIEVEPGLVAFRGAILGNADDAAFAESDAALRRGDPGAAVTAMLGAVQARPNDAAAWTGLASVYAIHDDGQVSPSAKFAFARAMALAPGAPGPPFFLGLAYAGAGDYQSAKGAWEVALAATPKDAPYRADIAMRVKLVDEFLAMPDR